ncbi:MAG: efflux RND transporter periplasmic adaptor subunit [Desulfomonile tiedjei]|nr:efflux RND transporter periplasmic adaptor subunit [Desulfomonile tiedjei]
MRELDTDKPRRRSKAFGVLLAAGVAIVSLVLVAITHEPKKAVSSPPPAKAAIVPPIADAKSEAEIIFRGKSYPVLKRTVVMPFKGEILSMDVKEGQTMKEHDTLASYKLDREAMMQVHSTLYPEMVLGLKKSAFDQKSSIEKLKSVDLKIKQIEVERVQKELADLRELFAKQMAQEEAVKNKERQLETLKKEILGIHDSIKQTESGLEKTNEDLRFYEAKRKRDIELLEWQTRRSYSDSQLPMDTAFLKAPIGGQVIWIAPDLRTQAEPPAGFPAFTIAPMGSVVVRCKVHELDLVKLNAGDRGTVVFDAIPQKKYPCTVSRIPWISRNAALEVPADYDIECQLENVDGLIKDGLTCNVKVSITQ